MRMPGCLRPADAAVTALVVAVTIGLLAAGREGWIAATSVVLVPIYLAAHRNGQHRR